MEKQSIVVKLVKMLWLQARRGPYSSTLCKSINKLTCLLQTCVYLFSGLPVLLWSPSTADMDYIRCWLLKADLASPEHQLACHLLSNLNWGNVGHEVSAVNALIM